MAFSPVKKHYTENVNIQENTATRFGHYCVIQQQNTEYTTQEICVTFLIVFAFQYVFVRFFKKIT